MIEMIVSWKGCTVGAKVWDLSFDLSWPYRYD